MGYEPQIDLGTPGVTAGADVTLTIDGRCVTVPEGTSVMRAAALVGGAIPKLCATDSLEAFGSCRMCLVEVEGMRGTPASCTTPVAPGMVVATQTPRLEKLRRRVMELYISDHPLDCLTCSANNDCELQDAAAQVGLRDVRYGYAGENHLEGAKDVSNPYFSFDAAKCIVCSRCVRACDEVQGTLALTISGRGFGSQVSAGQAGDDFLSSDCVSCGACVQACPTDALNEKAVAEIGKPERSVITTCAYCGVGCTFRAEMRGEQLVRMVPWKDGKANRGHSCVKGRFAWGYAQHKDRIRTPMIRESIDQPWREVGWEEALAFTAARLGAIKAKHGARALGGITSSRCTNEEVFLVQKLIRSSFGSNNVDTCARVCHSPTGYGLKTTFGTSAGTQDFDSVEQADVILVIGANPTDAHPVFASRMKRRIRQGAKLIVIDPRRIDLVRSPHIEAAHHLPLQPGTNVAVLTAMAHVIVTEGLADEAFIRERCDWDEYQDWAQFVAEPRHSPEVLEAVSRVPAAELRAAARLYATGGNAAIYYGLGVTEHSQGSSTVMAIANLAMATGNIGRPGVGVNPLRGQNNVQGSCDMGSFPHELSGYRHISDGATRALFEAEWGTTLDAEPGLRIPNMFDAALDGSPSMHVDGFARGPNGKGRGKFVVTDYIPTDEKTGPRFPLLLTTGRVLSQYNVGAQTRRTENSVWHGEDVLEIHPTDAENRGIASGDWVSLVSRKGDVALRAHITDRVAPGVVYTTFHHPETQANVVTTEFSDWATNCPEYKVTAVQVGPSNGPGEWQRDYAAHAALSRRVKGHEAAE